MVVLTGEEMATLRAALCLLLVAAYTCTPGLCAATGSQESAESNEAKSSEETQQSVTEVSDSVEEPEVVSEAVNVVPTTSTTQPPLPVVNPTTNVPVIDNSPTAAVTPAVIPDGTLAPLVSATPSAGPLPPDLQTAQTTSENVTTGFATRRPESRGDI
ncbi:hypothetical protein NFI96_023496 [Prochilodus magdalenae]|nr:hypothetical protein NFI96_023496 [Prochilodus magdalenae]